MRCYPVPSGLIRHLLLLELKRLGVVLGLPDVCLPVPPPLTPPILLHGMLPSGIHFLDPLPSPSHLLVCRLVRPAMPVSIGDDYSYSPRPFVVASAAAALPTLSAPAPAAEGMVPPRAPRSAPSSVTQSGPVPAPAVAPAPVVTSLTAPAVAPGPPPASAPAHAHASASAPASAPAPAAASDTAHLPEPALVVPLVPAEVPPSAPVVAASSPAVGAALLPPLAAPTVAPSAAVADPSYQPPLTTNAGPSLAEVQSAPVAPPVAPTGQPRRPQSPGRRPSRPHSPLLHDERESSRRRQDSPRGRRSQGNWTARRGGRGSWWGGRGYGRGAPPEEPPMTPAEIRQLVTSAVRDAQADVAGPNHPQHAAPRPGVPSLAAGPAAPSPRAPVPSVAVRGNRLRLPWVPPVAGVEFVSLGGGPVTPQYPTLLPVARAPAYADLPVHPLVGPSPSADVPEASLGQLWRLSEGLRAVHLIQVYCRAALSRGVPLEGGPLDECSDAADRLAELLASVLAAPARGGVAGVGQLGTTLRGLRRAMRAATAVDLIGATTVVVRELHRSLTGLLAVLDADQM
ncbi:unnamed protein product [Closterium sp. Naga37s-1]|nr:unnamed protein product [Closterium sp. Naga37s-1]